MLAQRRSLQIKKIEIERTPLLIPSYSSKGFPEVAKILKTTEEVIDGPLLVSAYDIYYKKILPPFDYASLIFLDSGGYEASKDTELSDFGERDHTPLTWKQGFHEQVLSSWKPAAATAIISYDHPKERIPVKEQLKRAKSMASGRKDVLREILLKPETREQTQLKVDSILNDIEDLAAFDIIGITEKEIGNSILSRMENIARLRMGLEKAGLKTPIHVFGSLDTMTTPLYFLAGADIFDGLTWLRFAFHDGYTMYKQNYGALKLGTQTKAHIIDGRCWFDNYYYMKDMELEMRRFLNGGDFSVFSHHSELFKHTLENTMEAVGV